MENENSKSINYNYIKHSNLDLFVYNSIVDDYKIMKYDIEVGKSVSPTFEYLYQDLFFSLYKYKLEFSDEDVDSSAMVNRYVMNELINSGIFKRLRSKCQLDEFNSAICTQLLGKDLIELLKAIYEKLKDQNQNADESGAEQSSGSSGGGSQDDSQEEQSNEQGSSSDESSYDQKNLEDNIKNKVQELNQKYEDISDIEELIEEADITKSMEEALQTINDYEAISKAWGFGTNEGKKKRISIELKRKTIEHILKSNMLKKFTDSIGRFKECAVSQQKKKSKHGAVEINSVTTGDRIEDLLPSEKINLSFKQTKKDFYRRMNDKQLLVYSKENTREMNKGPIIVCVDTSGSMQGSREQWSKSLTVAILEIAQLQKRDFACIIFAFDTDPPIVIEKNEIAPDKVVKIAETFIDGGTNFRKPLESALDLINDSKFKNADIVFITDGACYIRNDFIDKYNKIKKEKEFMCRGIIVGDYTDSCSLESFCDTINYVNDLVLDDADSSVNKNIFISL